MMPKSRLLALLGLVFLLSGCAMTMKTQPKYEPLAYSEFYPDGSSARHAPANTIARGVTMNTDPVLATGQLNGTPVPDFPFQLTADDLRRGQGLFDDTCAPCHGRTGAGDGVVVQRGFTKPPSLTAPNIVAMPAGQLYGFITNGFGVMPPYGPILQPTDRWRVVGYLRALQLSQNGTLEDVPPDKQNQIQPAGGQQ
ncbi:MAG: c-type cytochrome [Nitrososphaerales archaeon]